MDPEQSPILRYFKYDHLTRKLQYISKPFCDLAWAMETILPPGTEKSVALRKLLEAKDAAVRSALDMGEPTTPPFDINQGSLFDRTSS